MIDQLEAIKEQLEAIYFDLCERDDPSPKTVMAANDIYQAMARIGDALTAMQRPRQEVPTTA